MCFYERLHEDLPGMADIDASLLYFCRLVKEHNKVALTGECADEIFGGYPWFHKKEMFEEKDQELLEFIFKQAEIIRFVNSNANSNYRYYGKAMSESYVVLNNTGIDEMFDILKDTADVKGLLKYLNVVVEEENKTETKNEQEHPSFESLFNNSPIVNRR